MTNGETRYTFDRVVRMVVSAIIIATVLGLLRYLSDVVLPFAAAVVLAYMLNPLVSAFEKRTGRRGLAVAITIGGLGVMGAALLGIVIPLMAYQVSRFGEDLELLRQDLVGSLVAEAGELEQASGSRVEPVLNRLETSSTPHEKSIGWRELKRGWARYRADADEVPRRLERLRRLRGDLSNTYLGDLLDRSATYVGTAEFRDRALEAAKHLAVGGWTVIAFTVNFLLGLTGLIIVLLYLVFLLLDFPEYARNWQSFLPPQYREPIVEFLEQFNVALRRYFRGQAIVALCMAVLFATGFSIIGLPMAVPLGLFVGLLNMVPYLQTVGLVPAMLLALLRSIEGDSSVVASILLVLAVFAVAQLIQDTLITPRVMGKATGLRPVAILLGVFIWAKLLGPLGLLLAIPLTCLGIAYYRRYVLHHKPEKEKVSA